MQQHSLKNLRFSSLVFFDSTLSHYILFARCILYVLNIFSVFSCSNHVLDYIHTFAVLSQPPTQLFFLSPYMSLVGFLGLRYHCVIMTNHFRLCKILGSLQLSTDTTGDKILSYFASFSLQDYSNFYLIISRNTVPLYTQSDCTYYISLYIPCSILTIL